MHNFILLVHTCSAFFLSVSLVRVIKREKCYKVRCLSLGRGFFERIHEPHFSVMIFGNIDKPKFFFVFSMIRLLSQIFDGTLQNISLLFFLGTLNSKQIAPASLFTFPLRIKTLRVIPYFFLEVLEATKHMEETENHQQVIRLI